MNLRSLLIIAPGALLLIAAIAFVSVSKDDGHGHDHHGHSHGGHAHGDHDHSAHAAAHNHGGNNATSSAQNVELDHEADWQPTFAAAPLTQVWLSLSAAQQASQAALEAGTLTPLPDLAETIHLAAHALYDQLAELERAGADPQRLRAALAQVVRLSDPVLDHAQHGDLARSRSAFARLSSAIGVAAIRLPEVITEGARLSELPPITAKAGPHKHTH